MPDLFLTAQQLQPATFRVDPESVNGPWNFTLFPWEPGGIVPRDNGRIKVASATQNTLTPVTFTANAGDTIRHPDTDASVASYSTLLQGTIEFTYIETAGTVLPGNQWIVTQKPPLTFLEVWEATPITDIGIVGQLINWNFVQTIGAVSPVLFSHAAGVLTFQGSDPTFIRTSVDMLTQINHTNNSDAQWIYTPTFSGVGIDMMSLVAGFSQSSRVLSSQVTNSTSGGVQPTLNDTIQVEAITIETGATADLLAARLMFTIS